jgi:hypothetical protein
MDAYGCTNREKWDVPAMQGKTEETHNQKKELLLCAVC